MKLLFGFVAATAATTCTDPPAQIQITASSKSYSGTYNYLSMNGARPMYTKTGDTFTRLVFNTSTKKWRLWKINTNTLFAETDAQDLCFPAKPFSTGKNNVKSIKNPAATTTPNTLTTTPTTKRTTAAVAEVLNCNDPTTKVVQIKAGITNPTNDPKTSDGWSKDGSKWVKTYALADLGTPTFITEGGKDWMVLTATKGTTGCEEITVDGVYLCKDIGESYSFKCKYDLSDQKIKDTFSVTGQDTEATAEGTGTLSYTIEVDDNVEIGDTVNFTIKPVSPGLVYATATECNVKFNTQEVTIFGHKKPKCITSAVGSKWATTNDKASSQNDIKGEWTAFKWSTSTTKTDAESQTFECTIALSKDQDTTAVQNCPS